LENTVPVIHIPEDAYQNLVERAAVQNVSVEEYVVSTVARLASGGPSPEREPTPAERFAAFERWTQWIEERADRSPPGHVVDDSRESIYGERENDQL